MTIFDDSDLFTDYEKQLHPLLVVDSCVLILVSEESMKDHQKVTSICAWHWEETFSQVVHHYEQSNAGSNLHIFRARQAEHIWAFDEDGVKEVKNIFNFIRNGILPIFPLGKNSKFQVLWILSQFKSSFFDKLVPFFTHILHDWIDLSEMETELKFLLYPIFTLATQTSAVTRSCLLTEHMFAKTSV